MTETPRTDELLLTLISGKGSVEEFATLTDEHEREKALHVLLALLTDPDPMLRTRATQALGALGDQRSVEPLIKSLEIYNLGDEHDRDFFGGMFEALIAFGDPEAILPLALNLGSWRLRSLRERLLTAFDKTDLIQVFGDATDLVSGLRHMAFEYLGQIDDPRSVQFLLKALTDEATNTDDKLIRIDSACALHRKKIIEAVPYLLPYTSDSDGWIRQYTARCLGNLGAVQTVPALRLLLDDEERGVHVQSAMALAALGDPVGVVLTRAYLASGKPSFVYRHLRPVLEALSVIYRSLAPFLSDLRGIKIQTVMVHVAEALTEEGAPEPLEAVRRLLESDDPLLRRAAQRVLDDIKKWQDEGDDG